MPSPSRPCPCPSCHGRIRTAATIKRHAALQVRLEVERVRWHEEYEKVLKRAREEREREMEEEEESEDEEGESGEEEEESASVRGGRAVKRARVE